MSDDIRTITNKLLAFNTSILSDALEPLGLNGTFPQLKPLSNDMKCAGPVYTITYQPYSSIQACKPAGNYIDNVPAGSVLYIENQAALDCSVWGEILSFVAKLNRLAGTVINGACRDINHIIDIEYPVFSLGQTMISGKNRVAFVDQQVPIALDNVIINPNDYIFADAGGVVIIPSSKVGKVIEYAHNIKTTEDKILMSIKKGESLQNARKRHKYHKPWDA